MVGWHHQLNEQEQAPGDGEGLGSLVCCSPCGCKELDTTKQLNKRLQCNPARVQVFLITQCDHLWLLPVSDHLTGLLRYTWPHLCPRPLAPCSAAAAVAEPEPLRAVGR